MRKPGPLDDEWTGFSLNEVRAPQAVCLRCPHRVSQGQPTATCYFSTTSDGTRPRAETEIPWD